MRRLGSEHVQVIMFLVTLLAPIAVLPGSFDTTSGAYGVGIWAVVWRLLKGVQDDTFELIIVDIEHPFDNIGVFLMMSSISVIFAVQVVRYCNGKTSGRSTVFLGVLSILQPFILSYSVIMNFLRWGVFIYMGPIPIQFVVGLILMKLVPPPEPRWLKELDKEKGWWGPTEKINKVRQESEF